MFIQLALRIIGPIAGLAIRGAYYLIVTMLREAPALIL
jgi:hypothetical protein